MHSIYIRPLAVPVMLVTYSSTTMCRYCRDQQSLNLLSSILTILLTCPNTDSQLCYSNDQFFNSAPGEMAGMLNDLGPPRFSILLYIILTCRNSSPNGSGVLPVHDQLYTQNGQQDIPYDDTNDLTHTFCWMDKKEKYLSTSCFCALGVSVSDFYTPSNKENSPCNE